ncbi:hypothetical protein WDJ51_12435 [Rathayibacter sp. YIM 133350]|uniref:hypothetical protein n=1 Tax=Rathayibacter sp. YIM 133350 TaxID=3131992 RepID=UPI00307DDE25
MTGAIDQLDESGVPTDATDSDASVDSIIDESEKKIADAAASVTNADVKPAAQKASDATRTYYEFLRTVLSDPDAAATADFTDQVTAYSTSMDELQTICSG